MQIKLFCTLLFSLMSAICGQARAENEAGEIADPGTITVEAQRLELHLDRKMSAFGDAVLHRDNDTIFGDRIDYDLLNEEMHALGNARIEQGGNVVTGPELRMKLQEREGEMREAVFTLANAPKSSGNTTETAGTANKLRKTKSARGVADLLTFDGPNKETLKNASYTTCEVGHDDWFLNARELELDHYTQTATVHHATLEFQGVPILYTPWADFPLVNQRKSGFLTPSWGTTSKSGLDVSLPYYWNIAPNRDATITTRYLSKRGVQLQGDFRYLENNYSGRDQLQYLPSDDSSSTRTRYYANLAHSQSFGNGWSGGFNFERVSDDQYFADMTTHILTTSLVNLPQQAQVNYANETWNFSGLAQQFQTLDGISYPYQRLPQLTLNGHKDWDDVNGNLTTQWTSFARNDKAPSYVTAVTANRLVAYPSISVPLENPYGYATPKLGMHYTQYALSGDTSRYDGTAGIKQANYYQSDNRAIPILSVDSGMYFERDFRVMRNAYTQTLEPRLYYVYVPYRDQSRLPVFDTGLSDVNLGTLFTENQFSGSDRINDANQVSLAVTSRLIDKDTGVQRLAATIGERIYFSDQKVILPGGTPRTSNTSDIVTAATARLLNHWNVDAAWQYNTDSARTSKANIGARYNPEPGKTLNLSYRYTRDPLGVAGVNQIDLSSEWPLAANWYGLGRVNYSFLDNPASSLNLGHTQGMIESLAGVEYDAGCWQARGVVQRVSTATANANYAMFFQIELGGLVNLGNNSPLDLLKRSIPGYSNSALIPDNLH